MIKQVRLNGARDKSIIALRNAWDKEQESGNRSYMVLRGFEIYKRYGEIIQLAAIPYKDISNISSDVMKMALYIPEGYPTEDLIKKGLFSKQIKEYMKAAITIVDDEESSRITSVEQFDNIYMSIIRKHTKIVSSVEPDTRKTKKTASSKDFSLKAIEDIGETEESLIESKIEGEEEQSETKKLFNEFVNSSIQF
ncbi:MAG: hypothetical protein K6G88_08355 [Lachnospiraceae bacterium]|nr:hypothetical protein [Lachnospiraceae bacterium]